MSLLQAMLGVKQAFLEQRRSLRENVKFPAWVDLGDGSTPRDCTVLDVSDGGARIMLASPAGLPAEFDLVLSRNGTKRRCRLVWRSDDEAGVAYLGPLDRNASRKLGVKVKFYTDDGNDAERCRESLGAGQSIDVRGEDPFTGRIRSYKGVVVEVEPITSGALGERWSIAIEAELVH